MGNIKGHKFPLRIITLPATEFGPKPRLSERQYKRLHDDYIDALDFVFHTGHAGMERSTVYISSWDMVQ
jgi:hypothetical protein